jgi:hypothetical protein
VSDVVDEPLLLAETGDFPDIEAVVMDLLGAVEVDGVPVGNRSGTRTPTDVTAPYWHVFRAIGVGGMNPAGWSDTAFIYCAAWAPTREQARQMMRGARDLLAPFVDGGDHRGVFIDRAWESSGPGPLPTLDEDDRRVEGGWSFRMRRHQRPPVYAT